MTVRPAPGSNSASPTPRPCRSILLALLLLLAGPRSGQAAFFTRITDPGNPVVQEMLESGGASWADVDGDGFLDLFVANGNLSSVNNSLFLNTAGSGFAAVTTGPVVSDGGSSIGGTFGDFNRDGFLDLFVTNRSSFGNFLYTGGSGGSFTKVTTGAPVTDLANSNTSSWVDIDGDGELDLHVINFQSDNYWYRNGGPPSFTFSRVNSGSIVTDGAAFSIVGVWGDVNNDRRPDLFVGTGGAVNDVLHVNQGGGVFTTTTMNDARNTIGASWGDYDNDGDLDLVAAHFLGQNNRIYRNSGPASFTLVPVDTGIVSNDGGNSVGTAWGDVDNDGDLDLFVANDGQNNALYENLGAPGFTFRKVTGEAVTSDGGNSFGAALGDMDGDGDLDLFVANRLGQANFLYRNDVTGRGWLIVRCVGSTSNTSGIGARVRVRAVIGGVPVWQARDVSGQSGYNAQNLWVHFGLGDAPVIDSLVIEWPSGIRTAYGGVPHSRYVTAYENGSVSVPRETKGRSLRLESIPNPFAAGTRVRFALAAPAEVELRVYDLAGRTVAELARGTLGAGPHELPFRPAAGLGPGVYVVELKAGGQRVTTKVVRVE